MNLACAADNPHRANPQSCAYSRIKRGLRDVAASLIITFMLGIAQTVHADTLLIAAGAGYKRPLAELAATFEKSSGDKVEQFYGHMGAVTAQARQTGQVAAILGDRAFLERVDGLQFARWIPVGQGRLVIAWPRGGHLQDVKELSNARFARIAVPDTRSAIYGIAAMEFLHRSGLSQVVQERLQVASTVPQVSAYLVSGDIDAGFINITDAIGLGDQIGGYREIDPRLYSPIQIVAAVLVGHENEPAVRAWTEFLASPAAHAILMRYGL